MPGRSNGRKRGRKRRDRDAEPEGDGTEDGPAEEGPAEWADTDGYQVEVTLPDGSTVTQTVPDNPDPSGNRDPIESTLRDRDGNVVRSWDSDTGPDTGDRGYRAPEPEPTEEQKAEWAAAREQQAADRARAKIDDFREGEPLIQRWWRRLRAGHDPGIHPQAEIVDSTFPQAALDWFRRAPVMGTLILVFGTAVVVVPIVLFSLDGGSDDVDPPTLEFIDEDPTEDATDDTAAEEAEPAEEPEPEDAEQSSVPAQAGITEITALIDSACGGLYTVFLRATIFNNQETIVDQLFTAGGNAQQTSSGWSNDDMSVAVFQGPDFYEVWYFHWKLAELLAIYNIYGTNPGFDPPLSAEDLHRFAGVNSLADFTALVNGSEDSCAAETEIESAVTTKFPASSS